jgi:hypothetical protein
LGTGSPSRLVRSSGLLKRSVEREHARTGETGPLARPVQPRDVSTTAWMDDLAVRPPRFPIDSTAQTLSRGAAADSIAVKS